MSDAMKAATQLMDAGLLVWPPDQGSRKTITEAGTVIQSAIDAATAALRKENERLHVELAKAQEENTWGGAIIDRLNELVRENRKYFSEVDNLRGAAQLIQTIHGVFNTIRYEVEKLRNPKQAEEILQLKAGNERLKAERDHYQKSNATQGNIRMDVTAERDQLKAALEFYADGKHFHKGNLDWTPHLEEFPLLPESPKSNSTNLGLLV